MPLFQLEDRVRIAMNPDYPRYIGLAGKVIWISKTGSFLQLETDRKPPFSRHKVPPWIVTVRPHWIEKVA